MVVGAAQGAKLWGENLTCLGWVEQVNTEQSRSVCKSALKGVRTICYEHGKYRVEEEK